MTFSFGSKKIAILGATGHIAQSITLGLASNEMYELYLFARNLDKLNKIITSMPNLKRGNVHIYLFSEFDNHQYDVVINCIGIGNPSELLNNAYQVFSITEEYDNLVLRYLQKFESTRYINFSSGAAYGSDFHLQASSTKSANFNINNLSTQDYYGISKLNTEAKHRSLNNNCIIDLRVFGFFSSFIDLNSKFLLTDIINAINMGSILLTTPENIIRDYTHPEDLNALIDLCIKSEPINTVFDVYSLKPTTKFNILEYFSENHGLKYEIQSDTTLQSATGAKTNYYSENRNAESLGYHPEYDSIQSIIEGYTLLKMRTLNE